MKENFEIKEETITRELIKFFKNRFWEKYAYLVENKLKEVMDRGSYLLYFGVISKKNISRLFKFFEKHEEELKNYLKFGEVDKVNKIFGYLEKVFIFVWEKNDVKFRDSLLTFFLSLNFEEGEKFLNIFEKNTNLDDSLKCIYNFLNDLLTGDKLSKLDNYIQIQASNDYEKQLYESSIKDVYNFLKFHPEKIKDFLEIYDKILKDNKWEVDCYFWEKISCVLWAGKSWKNFIFLWENTINYLKKKEPLLWEVFNENELRKFIDEANINQFDKEKYYKVLKDIEKVVIAFYFFYKNRLGANTDLLKKQSLFYALLNVKKWIEQSSDRWQNDKENVVFKKKLIDKIFNNFVDKYFSIGSSKIDKFFKYLQNTNIDFSNPLPFFSENLIEKGFITKDWVVNTDIFKKQTKKIFDYWNLKSEEKAFIKQYVEWLISNGDGSKKELKFFKEQLDYLDLGVWKFLQYLSKNFRNKIENEIFSDEKLEKIGLSEKWKKQFKEILKFTLSKLSENPQDLLKKADKLWLWLFDYMWKKFFDEIVKGITKWFKVKDRSWNIVEIWPFPEQESKKIIWFLLENKEELFDSFENVVLDIEDVKLMTNKFLKDDEFLYRLSQIESRLWNILKDSLTDRLWKQQSLKEYIIVSFFILSKWKDVNDKILKNMVKDYNLKYDVLKQVLDTIKSDSWVHKEIKDLKGYYEKFKQQLDQRKEKIEEDFNQEFYDIIKKYDINLAEDFWNNYIDPEYNKIGSETNWNDSKDKSYFEEKLSSYITETHWKKPIWTYPENRWWNYEVVLYLPSKDWDKKSIEKKIEAPSIVELNKKLLVEWFNFQWLKYIDLEIQDPDTFKRKFWKDINKLFTPQDIEDINKVMVKYLIEKIDSDKQIRDYILSNHPDLYKDLIFNPLKWMSKFVDLLSKDKIFSNNIEKIFPKDFRNKWIFDISVLPDFISWEEIKDFFEKKKDEYWNSLWNNNIGNKIKQFFKVIGLRI